MRRSSMLVVAIMLIAFGTMFAAAGSALRPLAEEAEAAKLLTRMLETRGDIVPTSRVRLARAKAGPDRLAESGRGLVVYLRPTKSVCRRPGGLRALAIRSAHEGLGRFPDARLQWIEVVFQLQAERSQEADLRALLAVEDGSYLREPTPRLPKVVGPS